MNITCLERLAYSLLLDSIGPPPEADEFMAELCRGCVPETTGCLRYLPEAVVDGT